jgi:hypothetical protein
MVGRGGVGQSIFRNHFEDEGIFGSNHVNSGNLLLLTQTHTHL